MRTRHDTVVSVRIRLSDEARLGPGKIALLEAIERTGSIGAAGRGMTMSHRRAWLLIDSLNRLFEGGVVDAGPQDAHGDEARLTPVGRELVAAYRAMEADTMEAVARRLGPLAGRMRLDGDASAGAASAGAASAGAGAMRGSTALTASAGTATSGEAVGPDGGSAADGGAAGDG